MGEAQLDTISSISDDLKALIRNGDWDFPGTKAALASRLDTLLQTKGVFLSPTATGNFLEALASGDGSQLINETALALTAITLQQAENVGKVLDPETLETMLVELSAGETGQTFTHAKSLATGLVTHDLSERLLSLTEVYVDPKAIEDSIATLLTGDSSQAKAQTQTIALGYLAQQLGHAGAGNNITAEDLTETFRLATENTEKNGVGHTTALLGATAITAYAQSHNIALTPEVMAGLMGGDTYTAQQMLARHASAEILKMRDNIKNDLGPYLGVINAWREDGITGGASAAGMIVASDKISKTLTHYGIAVDSATVLKNLEATFSSDAEPFTTADLQALSEELIARNAENVVSKLTHIPISFSAIKENVHDLANGNWQEALTGKNGAISQGINALLVQKMESSANSLFAQNGQNMLPEAFITSSHLASVGIDEGLASALLASAGVKLQEQREQALKTQFTSPGMGSLTKGINGDVESSATLYHDTIMAKVDSLFASTVGLKGCVDLGETLGKNGVTAEACAGAGVGIKTQTGLPSIGGAQGAVTFNMSF